MFPLKQLSDRILRFLAKELFHSSKKCLLSMAYFNMCSKRKYLKPTNVSKDKARYDLAGIVFLVPQVPLPWSGPNFLVRLQLPWCHSAKCSHDVLREVKQWNICCPGKWVGTKTIGITIQWETATCFLNMYFRSLAKSFNFSAEWVFTKNQCFLWKNHHRVLAFLVLNYKSKMGLKGVIPKGLDFQLVSINVTSTCYKESNANLEQLKIKPKFCKVLCVLQTKK